MLLPNCLLILSLLQTSLANKDALPVLLMDSDKVMPHLNIQANPFAKVSVSYFTDVIHDAIERSVCIIIFVEDKLCSEDISLKDKLGSPYSHLHRGLLSKTVSYIPSVTEPYKTLTRIFRPQQQNVFYLSVGAKRNFLDNSSKYLYIYFKDGSNETRAQSLRKHDLLMQEVYFTVRQLKLGPVVAFYTGKVNPIAVEKVEFVPIKPKNVPNDLGITLISEGALFRFSGVFAASSLRRSAYNQMPLIAEETWTRRRLSTTMAYTNFELQFNFSFEEDQWLLDNVALLEGGEQVGRTEMGIGAPWNWSYVCGEPLSIINARDGSAVTISQYQIQPIHPKLIRRDGEEGGGAGGGNGDGAGGGNGDGAGGGNGGGTGGDGEGETEDKTKCFGKTVNCGPYFNTHILSGLFVTFICLAVMTYGVLMLYNCGVNDRFDDPHGKEVIVNTEQH